MFEDSTAVIWPWAATAEEMYQDDRKLKAVEDMLHYEQNNRYDTDQLYHALDQVFGVNPALSEQRESPSGMTEQRM